MGLVVAMTDDFGSWHLSVDLRSDGDTTVLTFTQHLDPPTLVKDTGPGWEYYLDRIIAARGGAPMPDFDDYYPSQQQHYLDAIAPF